MSIFFTKEPRVLNVDLAERVGLNEAIVLQQIEYWLKRSTHEHNGRLWVYNSYPEWQKQFPWWSEITLKRIFLKLEKDGLLISDNFNKAGFDKTKWYSIIHEHPLLVNDRTYQNDTMEGINLTRPIPEITQRLQKNNICADITEYEQQCLDMLQSVDNYPLDTKKDLQLIRDLVKAYPKHDVLSVVRTWVHRKLDQPLKKSEKPRGQISNWMKNEATKYNPNPITKQVNQAAQTGGTTVSSLELIVNNFNKEA